jgi:tetraacyldisaccharide-1-P 4'-kinase
VASAGWDVAGTMSFRDHHPFVPRDVTRIAAAARAAGSAIVLTTEKDAIRLAALPLGDLPIAAVPLVIRIEPDHRFRDWLRSRVVAAAAAHQGAA